MNNETNRYVFRLPPCPSYDVEGMEKWLSDQAEKGLLLAKDGFFLGVATFEKCEPCYVKYRLEAAQKNTSMWADNGGDPDPEQIELSEKYAWEYVTKRGDFFIYRSFNMDARELNIDPDVQALRLNAVKKRQRWSAFYLMFWFAVYPLLHLRGGILLTIINMRTWLFLLTTFFVLWLITDKVKAFVSLRRLQRKLREDGCLQKNKDWRKGVVSYHGKRAVKFVLAIALLYIFLNGWSDSVMNTDKVQLDKYTGTLPFASMRDFVDTDITNYRMTMTGMNMGFNTIQEWSDYLAPQCIDYNEEAAITLSDGRVLDGGYYVDYYETRSPAIAKQLTKEMYRIDSREKHFELMDTLTIGVECDSIYVYWKDLHLPTVIIQNGNKVIHAYFYQNSSSYSVPVEEWISAVAKSIDN